MIVSVFISTLNKSRTWLLYTSVSPQPPNFHPPTPSLFWVFPKEPNEQDTLDMEAMMGCLRKG